MAFPLRALQPLTLQFLDDGVLQRYSSRIVDYTEEKELIIDVPYSEGQEVLVPHGTPVIAEVLQVDGLRRFPSVVIGRLPMYPPCLQLAWPKDIERIQRRSDVRVAASLRVEMEFRAQPEGGPSTMRGDTSDISAGGLRVVTQEPIPENTSVLIRLYLPSNDLLVFRGEALRGGDFEVIKGKTARWTAIRFSEITERDRRELTKLVFEIQRELLRRE